MIYIYIGTQENASSSFADAVRDTPATVVEALICFFSIWSVLGLWGYHTYLICRSVTTNEDVCFLINKIFVFNFFFFF
jgi:palmitoyltransferase ZDHHC9/14/18